MVLALLVAFAAGTVMTAVAGARRGASAVDRLLDRTEPATVVVLPNEVAFDWDAVRALPEVEALTTFVVTEYQIEGIPQEALVGYFPPGDADGMRTVERAVVLEGRLADPTNPHEVVVSPRFAASYEMGIGDPVTLRLFTPEQVDAHYEGFEPATAEGPAVEARIVGVVRSSWFGDKVGHTGFLVPSAGLYAQYAPNLLGAESGGYINALVRLEGGASAIPEFKANLAEVSGRGDIDVWDTAEFHQHAREVTAFEAKSLAALALAAAVAALFLVGQAIGRFSAATVAELQVLRAMGMTPTESLWAAAVGPALAGVVGVAVGVSGAVTASRWFPIGSASLLEPSPGTNIDMTVLAVGTIAVPVLVAAGAFGAAWFALRRIRPADAPRRSALAAAVARAGVPLPVVVGTRFALEPGRGGQAAPVQPALLGAIIGVLGVLAALTFSGAVGDAAAHPERFGQTHELEAFLGFNGSDLGPVDEMLALAADDPDVVAVNDTRINVAQIGHVGVSVFSLDPVGEPLEVVVTTGRLPEGPDEVALAPRSAEALGVDPGDSLELSGTRGRHRVTVTGLAFVPVGPHNDYATGAWITRKAYDDLFEGFKFHVGLIALRGTADSEVVAARLQRGAGEGGMELTPPLPPPEVAEIQQVRALPLFLAGFLALLALGAVGHALATAVRRRRLELASMRALGMTPWQCRAMVVTHATVLALVGLAVGVPLGIALGRMTWRSVAESTPLQYLPPVSWWALVLVVPVALVAANVLAAWPSHRAASLRVGQVLRTE